jgi:hypothetical protein
VQELREEGEVVEGNPMKHLDCACRVKRRGRASTVCEERSDNRDGYLHCAYISTSVAPSCLPFCLDIARICLLSYKIKRF